ncbi:bidirectional sugar transporter SWEET17 isoform X2 [Arachis ipaensis]|uniref:bidirectional sugar transporter SWEET17 isoform X2 n=1 Tax=Arachis ipaensis TaxID=130454 RepID=UPI0007AF40E8|nr:bidirectional sugar transporter SWEET17 isoform X2 [Arachis ipaensis]XP_025646602.1 bidirectional sugar transporter SWEET17 isoform X2 [Arachis hypogaea]QHO06801.1 Bidirectional sugar transporter [Arachis hypogaea]
MAELNFFVGVIGNIISILMFLSPMDTFVRIIKKKSTEDFSSIPYICTLLNSSLWTYYGIIKEGEYLVATVNGFGIFLQIIYILLFLLYAPKTIKIKSAIVAGILDVGVLGAAILTSEIALKGEARTNAVGVMGAGLNILMYASPLAAMVPNGTGFVLGAMQLILYCIYRNGKSSSKHTSKQGLEEGSQYNEHLISHPQLS